jgi:hypothetical protein
MQRSSFRDQRRLVRRYDNQGPLCQQSELLLTSTAADRGNLKFLPNELIFNHPASYHASCSPPLQCTVSPSGRVVDVVGHETNFLLAKIEMDKMCPQFSLFLSLSLSGSLSLSLSLSLLFSFVGCRLEMNDFGG